MAKPLHPLWLEPWAIATCVRVTLRDGSVFGATTWGEAIRWDGLDYDPSDGAQMETFTSSLGAQVTMFKVTGLLGSRFSADDVRFLWPGAAVLAFNVIPEQDPSTLNWHGHETAGADVLVAGKLGAIQIPNEVCFTAEFRATMAQAAGLITRSVQRKCPFRFGKSPCPAVPPTHIANVSAVAGRVLTFTLTPSVLLDKGSVEALAGANAGVQPLRIVSAVNAGGGAWDLTLADAFPFALAVGTSCRITEGCDHLFPTCKLYNPAAAGRTAGWPYGGFRDVPGQDKLNVRA